MPCIMSMTKDMEVNQLRLQRPQPRIERKVLCEKDPQRLGEKHDPHNRSRAALAESRCFVHYGYLILMKCDGYVLSDLSGGLIFRVALIIHLSTFSTALFQGRNSQRTDHAFAAFRNRRWPARG